MSVQFIGNCEWEAIDAPRWTVGGWGVDVATVPLCGRRDKKETFLNSLTRFGSLAGFPGMRLRDAGQGGGTISIPVIDANFVGFRTGVIPPEKAVNSITTQSISGSGSYTSGGSTFQVSGQFTYKASRTTWTWFETSTPATSPRFASVQQQIDPLDPNNIVTAVITDEANGRLKNVPYAAFVSVFNSLIRRVIVSDYVREPIIPGALWACESCVEYKLIN